MKGPQLQVSEDGGHTWSRLAPGMWNTVDAKRDIAANLDLWAPFVDAMLAGRRAARGGYLVRALRR